MKKILTLSMILALTGSVCFASNDFSKAFKKSVKQDIENTRSQYREAVRKDIESQRQANLNASNSKKAEKIKQIDKKLAELNKEMAEVKADKKITETQRLMETRSIQRQINFYKSQKDALK